MNWKYTNLCFRCISRNDLQEYIKTYYTPARMVLAGAGGVDHDSLVQAAKSHFGCATTTSASCDATLTRCRFTGSDLRVRDDAMPLAHVAIAVEGCGWNNPDNIPLMVGNTLIG